MEKTIEDRAEYKYHGNTIEQDAYICGATEQKQYDEEVFISFLSGLRSGNIWLGNEWKFVKEWNKYKKLVEEHGLYG